MASEKSVMLVIRASRPSFQNCHDKVAFAVHAAFMAAGYILHLKGFPVFRDDVLTTCQVAAEVGIEGWNAISRCYGFVYSHPRQGSKRVRVRGFVLDDTLSFDVLKEGDSEESSHHLDVNTMEYVENEGRGTNYASHFKNLARLVDKVNRELLRKLDGSSTSATAAMNRLDLSTTAPNRSGGFRFGNDFRNAYPPLGFPPPPPFFPPPFIQVIFPGPPIHWHFDGRPEPPRTMLHGNNITVDARPAPKFQTQQRYSKVFANLGVICKCCNGEVDGNCRDSWDGICSDLRCLPWKLH
ncbi:putative proteasome inhibitor [Dorcoceras hygrometricum]|uniref:Putative proteasome inhibitor n=1 Tax=Dorcoceras hygrometricum TaxID=472368 RepID=A0A2Z7D3K5_9LAMI|nr:putative proteasome inhibitor [Dorcoceras hygrometricum]